MEDYPRTLAEFEPRWNELVIACRGSWINLSAYGVLGDSLVVLVEVPNHGNGPFAPELISVNFSGPPGSRWDISHHLLIDGPATEETRLDHIKKAID